MSGGTGGVSALTDLNPFLTRRGHGQTDRAPFAYGATVTLQDYRHRQQVEWFRREQARLEREFWERKRRESGAQLIEHLTAGRPE